MRDREPSRGNKTPPRAAHAEPDVHVIEAVAAVALVKATDLVERDPAERHGASGKPVRILVSLGMRRPGNRVEPTPVDAIPARREPECRPQQSGGEATASRMPDEPPTPPNEPSA